MAKRSNGEGSIRKRPNGTWRAEIMDGFTEDGKRRIVRFSGKTRSEVQEKLRAHQRRVEENVHLDKTMGFSKWAGIWYDDYQSQVRPSTYSGYKYTLALLKGYFKETPIAGILPLHINRFSDSIVRRGYSMSQIRKCRAMLIQIFNAAEDNGLIVKNPASRAKKIGKKDGRVAKPVRRKDAFTDKEISLLLTELPNDLIGNGIRAMLGTGMRVQELNALKPEDIAADGSFVNINKAIETVDGIPVLSVTKSELSTRTVPVPEDYRQALRYLREHSGPSFVYSASGNHEYYSVGSFRRRYYTALAKVEKVRKLTPHCCRHTYATQLEKEGVPLQIIAKLMGHASVETTGVYLHTDQTTFADAVASLNRKTIQEASNG